MIKVIITCLSHSRDRRSSLNIRCLNSTLPYPIAICVNKLLTNVAVGRHMTRRGISIMLGVAALELSGCASLQLNHNTIELGTSVNDLQKQQILYNLSLFADDPAALPTHLDLTGGTAQTQNTVQPTVGFPLGVSALSQFTQSTAMG